MSRIDRFDEMLAKARLAAATEILVHAVTAHRDGGRISSGAFLHRAHHIVAGAIGQAEITEKKVEIGSLDGRLRLVHIACG